MKSCIEWILIAVSAFIWLGGVLSHQKIERVVDRAVAWLPALLLIAYQMLIGVDRFAGWWGAHAVWKLAVAALLLAAFPLFAWTYLRTVSLRVHRVWWYTLAGVIWIGMVGMVVSDWIAFPHPRGGLPPEGWGLDWVAQHPTPAIHHLYANATYLGFYIVAIAVLLWGRPMAATLSRWLGSRRVANAVSGAVLLGSTISKLAFD